MSNVVGGFLSPCETASCAEVVMPGIHAQLYEMLQVHEYLGKCFEGTGDVRLVHVDISFQWAPQATQMQA